MGCILIEHARQDLCTDDQSRHIYAFAPSLMVDVGSYSQPRLAQDFGFQDA
jgi:hypothetical protein